MKTFWTYFNQISDIPRTSGNEEEICEYIVKFALKNELKYHKDKSGNVYIYKDFNSSKDIIFQAHLDMVGVKTERSKHNFQEDGLKLEKSDDFISASGTSLGADNGIGVAYILDFLTKNKATRNVLVIFTVEEETTMRGAANLNKEELYEILPNDFCPEGIISFDGFSDSEIILQSFGAKVWEFIFEMKTENNIQTPLKFELTDFPGGHSGEDILDETRKNPIKILAEKFKESNIAVQEISTNHRAAANVIPRSVNMKYVNFMDENSKKLIKLLNFLPHGLINEDHDEVKLTGNLAKVQSEKEQIKVIYSARGLSEEFKQFEDNLNIFCLENKIMYKKILEIPPSQKKEKSDFLDDFVRKYENFFHQKPELRTANFCTEMGYLQRIFDVPTVIIAPNIYDAHSPNESLQISSTEKVYEFIESYYFPA